jgi:hypothetical protein
MGRGMKASRRGRRFILNTRGRDAEGDVAAWTSRGRRLEGRRDAERTAMGRSH